YFDLFFIGSVFESIDFFYAIIAGGQFVNLYFLEELIDRSDNYFFKEKCRYRGTIRCGYSTPYLVCLCISLILYSLSRKVAFNYYYIFRSEKDITNRIFFLIFCSQHL